MTISPIKLTLGGFNNLIIVPDPPVATRQAKRHEAAETRRFLKKKRSFSP